MPQRAQPDIPMANSTGRLEEADDIYLYDDDSLINEEELYTSNYGTHDDSQDLEAFCQSRGQPRSSTLDPLRPQQASTLQLPHPVVIPQRRPGHRGRGFVEAYAPELERFGIGQDEFICFIQATNKSVQVSKWIHAVQIVATGTSFIPNHIALGASVGVQIVAGVIAVAETRWKFNSLLDRANDEFFRPRGLYCLTMSYEPLGAQSNSLTNPSMPPISSSLPASQQQQQPRNLLSSAKHNLRNPVSGKVMGEESLPENVASLVYIEAPERQTTKKRDTMNRLANYLDLRAQARYADESKGDVLSGPSPPQFKHRYLDPNHPATNGGLLGLISGGRLTPDKEKMQKHLESTLEDQNRAIQEQQNTARSSLREQLSMMNLPPDQEHAYLKQYEDAFEIQDQQMAQQKNQIKLASSPRRIVKNILYLMIVQLPSEEQISEARRHLEASDGMQVSQDVTMRVVES